MRLRGVGHDFCFAAVNLLTTWPLVLVMILVVTWIGQHLPNGKGFQIEPHPGLKQMMDHPRGLLLVLLIVMATVMAPISEELIFRGILQSLVRGYTERPWLSIAVTSCVFASVHGNPTHWPALFVLSLGLGYSYEKSQALWRPIFMHAFFNGVTVLSNLIG